MTDTEIEILELFKKNIELQSIKKDETISVTKFKNLLVFILITNTLVDNNTIKEVEYNYILEKYKFYVNENCEIEKIINFIIEINNNFFNLFNKNTFDPNQIVNTYNKIFGDKSFNNISEEYSYEIGLHKITRIKLFEPYLKSRKFKIWRLLN